MEAAGVEPASVLQTRKLLTLRTDKKDKTDTSPITAYKMHTKSLRRSRPRSCEPSEHVMLPRNNQPPRSVQVERSSPANANYNYGMSRTSKCPTPDFNEFVEQEVVVA